MAERREVAINVPVLARVEGEGALDLTLRDGAIDTLHLRIFEPPRLFEKFLEGRGYEEVPDLVARICGICPVAYQMSAVHALESVFGVEPGPWVRAMRRLYYCGEWIESHALHIHMLAAPDFLGAANVAELAAKAPEAVRRGLRLQALGNDLIRLLGARSVNPVGARVGGFHRAPAPAEVAALLERLRAAEPEAAALVAWAAALPLPDDHQSFTCVALRHEAEYPMNAGRLVSSAGLDIAIADYREHFTESHIAHSTALHSHLEGAPYLVGPLARLNLNRERLPEAVAENLAQTGIAFPSDNMFHSVVARAVEIHYAVVEAIRLLEGYTMPEAPALAVTPRAGTGYGCTEAPRGILWHRYEVDADGHIRAAEIVPPTSQNQPRIEADLRASLEQFGLERPVEAIRHHAETVIRNYDPCISCATHFLKVNIR